MFRAQRRFLIGIGGLLTLAHLAGELNLCRYNWPEVGQLNLVARSGRGERLRRASIEKGAEFLISLVHAQVATLFLA